MSEGRCKYCQFPVALNDICDECMKSDDFEREIIQRLGQKFSYEFQKSTKGPKKWTNEIKSIIGKIGIDNKFNVCASGEGFENEWLYDMVWYKNNNDGRLESVELVMESEISDYNWKGIKYDFEKLLIKNAKRRVMIRCAMDKKKVNKHFECFKKGIDNYNNGHSKDRYLIIIYNEEDGWFYHRLILK